MAQQILKKSFSFVAGLNTEGGELVNPPNSWVEGDNVIPQTDGSIVNRQAIDLEEGYVLSTDTLTSIQKEQYAYAVAEWTSVAGNGNQHFTVVQHGRNIFFYLNSGLAISGTKKAFSIDISAYTANSSPYVKGTLPCDFVNVNGKLLIVSGATEPVLVTYDADADDITVEQLTLKERDFVGLDDGLAVDEHPIGTLSVRHNYNLLNQGWDSTKITDYEAAQSRYPSNAQSWIWGKNPSDAFTPSILDLQDFGTSPAPKGRFIMDIFRKDREEVSGLTMGDDRYTIVTSRPTTAAFFAGRAWYAGVEDAELGTTIWFSQVYRDDSSLSKCYQDNDPTAEIVSDLLASDGGYVRISDAGKVKALRPFGKSLYVFADNGIWAISGTATIGFAADSYEVTRVANVGILSAQALIRVPKGFVMWSDDGIYAVGQGDGGVSVSTVSSDKIQTLYDAIPEQHKENVRGAYSPLDSSVYWIYSDDDAADGVVDKWVANRILVLDVSLGAFYTHTVSSVTDGPNIVGLWITRPRVQDIGTADVTTSLGVNVTDSGLAQVTVADIEYLTGDPHVMFLVQYKNGANDFRYTFAEFGAAYDESNLNLITNWESFNTTWTPTNATVGVDVDTGPDNASATVDAIRGTAGLAEHSLQHSFTMASDSTDYTCSVWVKAGTQSVVRLAVQNKVGTVKDCWYNLSTGAVGTDNSDGSSITSYGGGWYRLTITCDSAAGGSVPYFKIAPVSADAATTYTATGGVDDLLVWGAKAEEGSAASKYVPVNSESPEVLRDWYSFDGVGAGFVPYLTTGYDFSQAGADRFIQLMYIMTYLRRTVTGTDSNGAEVNPSSILMRGKWEWADSAVSNRWSTPQQIYRNRRNFMTDTFLTTFDDGQPVVYAKSKLRGRGHVLQLNFTGEVDKHFEMLGWSALYLGTENV